MGLVSSICHPMAGHTRVWAINNLFCTSREVLGGVDYAARDFFASVDFRARDGHVSNTSQSIPELASTRLSRAQITIRLYGRAHSRGKKRSTRINDPRSWLSRRFIERCGGVQETRESPRVCVAGTAAL